MKVNLGCGPHKLDDWINIDINPEYKPDYCINLGVQSLPFKNDSVDELWCSHTLEHIPKKNHEAFILEIQRVLKKGSLVTFSYPEFLKCVSNWTINFQGKKDFWEATIFGRQTTKWEAHVCAMHTADFIPFVKNLGLKYITHMEESKGEPYNTIISFLKSRNIESREDVLAREIFEVGE
ncbi:hypothetical protein LCGC14_1498020 [marine sediment metagenome]|uniref:Methyltransferase type 11 domain-containing protein n=1 Tax=marine sediment metagenome TaxID=412755 RepID=A0A0F9LKK7_9ZZZZ